MARLIGQPIPRLEDRRLLTGRGRYTDDLAPRESGWAFLLRSPHAHARLLRIDTDTAKRAPGVRAILTAADYRADGLKPLAHHVNGPDAIDGNRPAFDAPLFIAPQPVLAEDRVRFVGEAVALVIADSLDQARDAAELIAVDYDLLPAVVTAEQALATDAPLLHAGAPGNLALSAAFGDRDATDRAFARAHLVVEQAFSNQRVLACQMEPRSAFASFDAASGRYEVVAGGQGIVRQRLSLAACLGIAKEQVHFTTPDTGGGFGARTSLNPEVVLVAWAARRSGRPVRWVADRSEGFLADYQGRDLATHAALALDEDGRILAIRCAQRANLGAHTASFAPLANGYRLVSTLYDVPAAWVGIEAALTNTAPTVPYRGAGRPEATLVIERLLDRASHTLGIDRIALRRRNLVAKHRLPYRNAMGLTYDSGDFHLNMEQALALADWDGFAARRAASGGAGRLRGIGLANYVEAPVGALRERVAVTVASDGAVEIVAGTQSTGQGHETVFAQVAADRLGLPLDRIRLVTGDSARIEIGGGSHSDRSMRLVGSLLAEACDTIVARARTLAAERLGIPAPELAWEDGHFSARGSNRRLDLAEIARESGPLSAAAEIDKRLPAHPTGCAIAEIEVDPETGRVAVQRYVSIDDVGQAINPLIVDGQVHGGIVQGIGEALYERLGIDAASGQVTGGSFMDYCLPRADLLPRFEVRLVEDPTSGNVLRVKGGGECGITPAMAAIGNALADALGEEALSPMTLPATPERIWRALQRRRDRPARRKSMGPSLVAFAVLALAAFAGVPAAAQDLSPVEQLYAELAKLPPEQRQQRIEEGARKEGAVTFIHSWRGALARNHIALFSKRYPAIKVEFIDIGSQDAAERLVTEETAGRHLTDIANIAVPDLPYLLSRRIEARYPTPAAARIFPQYSHMVDAENRWLPFYWSERGISYNPSMIPAAKQPKDWFDLCDPVLKHEVSFDPFELRFLAGMFTVMGEEKLKSWLACIGENQPIIQRGYSQRMMLMLAGDHAAQGDNYLYQGILEKRKDPSLPFAIAWGAAMPANIGSLVINRNAAHPYAAALLADWALSEESQRYAAENFRGPVAYKHPFMPEDAKIVSYSFVGTDVADRLQGYWNDLILQRADKRQ